jgi:hypothetical protein
MLLLVLSLLSVPSLLHHNHLTPLSYTDISKASGNIVRNCALFPGAQGLGTVLHQAFPSIGIDSFSALSGTGRRDSLRSWEIRFSNGDA